MEVSLESDLAGNSEGKNGESHISFLFHCSVVVVISLDGVGTSSEAVLLHPVLRICWFEPNKIHVT